MPGGYHKTSLQPQWLCVKMSPELCVCCYVEHQAAHSGGAIALVALFTILPANLDEMQSSQQTMQHCGT